MRCRVFTVGIKQFLAILLSIASQQSSAQSKYVSFTLFSQIVDTTFMKASTFIDEYTLRKNTHLDLDEAIIALDYIDYHGHLFCFLICVYMIYDRR